MLGSEPQTVQVGRHPALFAPPGGLSSPRGGGLDHHPQVLVER